MKKLFTLFSSLLFAGAVSAQMDTLLWEDFEADTIDVEIAFPTGNDQNAITFDGDGLADQSGGTRPDEWFLVRGFADVDSNTTAMGANSWTNDPINPVQNWLIMKPITLFDGSGMLRWKSAPRQTPRYCDGYKVVISETGNLEEDFSDTVKVYAEMTGLGNDSTFTSYTFSSGFVFGLDQQYIEYHNDSARWRGILRPDSVSLSAYSGKTIYIGFLHDSHDDNLISIDDILVTGNGTAASINESSLSAKVLLASPNPAADQIRLDYRIENPSSVDIKIIGTDGKLVKNVRTGFLLNGDHFSTLNVQDLPSGVYEVVIEGKFGRMSTPVVISR